MPDPSAAPHAGDTQAARTWRDALDAAALVAVDPRGLGGVLLRSRAGPVRDVWLAQARAAWPEGAPWRRVPLGIADTGLSGGLDLAATLAAGRPVMQRGLVAEASGGALVVPMAERWTVGAAARIAMALDSGAATAPPLVIALDEGAESDERLAAPLAERLALHVTLDGVGARDAARAVAATRADVERARALLPRVAVPESLTEALCAASIALGVASMRAPLHALRVARAQAALAGRAEANVDDAAAAVRLVLAPRATRTPAMEDEAETAEEPQSPPDAPPEPEDASASSGDARDATDIVLEAARALLPAGLLASLHAAMRPVRHPPAGQAGANPSGGRRGRAIGVRRGDPRRGERLDLVETLRAAAPWQRLRGRDGPRLRVHVDDFRVVRREQPASTTTVFVVDASGSSAAHRLGEAKGAVERLLAECYVRRDRVALIAFRGRAADLLLPPTRSLVRAKRQLAGLPGGGATPLAAGLAAAHALAEPLRRRGDTPLVVILTDGRANVALDGTTVRERATADALAAARALRDGGFAAVLVDTSPAPQPAARALADALAARYLPLPHADAATLARAVRAA